MPASKAAVADDVISDLAEDAQERHVYSYPLYVAPGKLIVTAFLSPKVHGAQIFAFVYPVFFEAVQHILPVSHSSLVVHTA